MTGREIWRYHNEHRALSRANYRLNRRRSWYGYTPHDRHNAWLEYCMEQNERRHEDQGW